MLRDSDLRPRRAGTTLMEVLIALVMLATAGVGFATLLGQTAQTLRTVRNSERLARAGTDALNHVVVMGRAELAARVGATDLEGLRLHVIDDGSGLFDVSVAESDTSASVLRTTVYRPDTTGVGQ